MHGIFACCCVYHLYGISEESFIFYPKSPVYTCMEFHIFPLCFCLSISKVNAVNMLSGYNSGDTLSFVVITGFNVLCFSVNFLELFI